MALLRLYGLQHPPGCQCPDCDTETATLADGGFSLAPNPIPAQTVTDFLNEVHSGNVSTKVISADLHDAYFNRLLHHAEAGWGERFNDQSRTDQGNFLPLRENARAFAAAKQRRLLEELEALRTKYPNRDDWEKAARSAIHARHHGAWMTAEQQTALAAAQNAESWHEQLRRADLYPNLKYITANDERVRETHRTLDEVIRPINDPFWAEYYPPNGWRCRCKTVQTDEEPTAPRNYNFAPPKGFDHNPGVTGNLFADSHPYFDLTPAETSALQKEANRATAQKAGDGWVADVQQARKQFRMLKNYPDDAIGYDPNSGGAIILHEGHQPDTLNRELPAAIALRKQGWLVWLLDEAKKAKGKPDAIINDQFVEMRQIRDAENFTKRFSKHIEGALKNSENVLIHIAQEVTAATLLKAVRENALRRPALHTLYIVWKNETYRLTRAQMLEADWLK